MSLSRALVAATALHGFVLALLASRPSARASRASARPPVELTILAPVARPPSEVALPERPRLAMVRTTRALPRDLTPRAPGTSRETAAPTAPPPPSAPVGFASAEPSSPPSLERPSPPSLERPSPPSLERSSPSPSPGTVNLFPRAALGEIARASTPIVDNPLDRPVVAGDPRLRPRNGAEGAATVEERVGLMLGRATGANNATSGRVPPELRSVERALAELFHPRADEISDKTRTQALYDQLRDFFKRGPSGGTLARGQVDNATRYDGPDRDVGIALSSMEQQFASIRSASRAAGWVRAEVRVIVEPDGEISLLQLERGSGRRAVDRQALEAVRVALRAHTGRLPRGERAEAIFSLEASVRVVPPSTTFSMTFDESLRTIKPDIPLKRDVELAARLVSYSILSK